MQIWYIILFSTPFVHFISGFMRRMYEVEKIYVITGEISQFSCMMAGIYTYFSSSIEYIDDWFLYSNPTIFAALMIENLY